MLYSRRMLATVSWSVAGLVSLLTAIGLYLLSAEMAPMQPGTPEVFWNVACGVRLQPDVDEHGRAYFVDDEWVAYDLPHFHGSNLYYLPTSVAAAHFDAV